MGTVVARGASVCPRGAGTIGENGPMSPEQRSVHEPARWASWFVAVSAVTLVVVLVVSLFHKHHPSVGPDEFGFLLNGQRLSGHFELPLAEGMRSFYMAGYGFVTAAAAVIGGSIKAEFTISLAFNLVFVALTGLTVYALGVRHLHLSRAWSRAAAVAACAMPTLAANALFSWSESLARLCFTLLVFLVFEWSGRPSLRIGLPTAVLVAWMPIIHGRFTLVLPIVVVVLLIGGVSRDARRVVTAGVSTAVLVVAYLLMRSVNTWLRGELYPGAGGKEGRVVRKIFDPSNYRDMARAILSQGWYVSGTTLGLAALGVLVLVVMTRDGVRARRRGAWMGPGFALAASLTVIFTSSLQLTYIVRPDHLAYGRYPEVITPVLLVAGIAFVVNRGRRTRWTWWAGLASIAALCVLLLAGSGGDNLRIRMARGEYFESGNGIGLDVPKHLLAPMGYVSVTVLCLLVGAAVMLLARWRPEAGLALFTLVSLVCTVYTVTQTIVPRRDYANHLTLDDKIRSMTEDPDRALIGFDARAYSVHPFFDFRFQLHPIQVRRTNIEIDLPEGMVCVIGVPDRPPQPDWHQAGEEGRLGLVLWKQDGVDSC